MAALRITGPAVTNALDHLLTCRIAHLAPGASARGLLLANDGKPIAAAAVIRRPSAAGGGLAVWDIVMHDTSASAVTERVRAVIGENGLAADPARADVRIKGIAATNPAPVDALTNAALASIPATLPSDAVGAHKAHPALVDLTKPFFAGQAALAAAARALPARATYTYKAQEWPIRETVLHPWHVESKGKMIPFGGWDMPVQYPTGIFAEHKACRTAAALFDVSHMSILEVQGHAAGAFLRQVFANDPSLLAVGRAFYNYLLYPDGRAVDDAYAYRVAEDRFLIVVNAGNAEEDFAWLQAAASGEFAIDAARPWVACDGPIQLRQLRNAGADSLIDLALQGPKSRAILQQVLESGADRAKVGAMQFNDIVPVTIGGHAGWVAGTGYTGEQTAFEVFVHPDAAAGLWSALVETGASEGLLAAGLGARDSLRTEAGLPLFGHELEGEIGGNLTECGYGFVIDLSTPFFAGRDPYAAKTNPRKRKVVRLRGNGARSLRPGHLIVDAAGTVKGVVSSFAYTNAAKDFIVMAFVDMDVAAKEGSPLTGARLKAAEHAGGPVPEAKTVALTVARRMPNDAEKAGWAAAYAKA